MEEKRRNEKKGPLWTKSSEGTKKVGLFIFVKRNHTHT